MILRADWWTLIKRAWSIRFLALAVLVQAADVGLPFFYGRLPVSDAVFGWLTIILAIAAGVSRLVPQRGITPSKCDGPPNADQ